MTIDGQPMPETEQWHLAHLWISDNYPEIAEKLDVLDHARSAEETYRRIVERSALLWSALRNDIDKIKVTSKDELFEVSDKVKDLSSDLFFELNRYSNTITYFHGQLVGGNYQKMIIAFRNSFEHGMQDLPVFYKYEGRKKAKFEWALGVDLVLLLKYLASGKRRLRKKNIERIDELVAALGEFANLSDLFERTVFAAVSGYPSLTATMAAETSAAIRDVGNLKKIIEDDEMKEIILEVIDDHIEKDQLREQQAKENSDLKATDVP